MLDKLLILFYIFTEALFIYYTRKTYKLNIKMVSTLYLFSYCSFSVLSRFLFLLSFYLKIFKYVSEYCLIGYFISLYLLSIFLIKKFVFDNFRQERLFCWFLSVISLMSFILTTEIQLDAYNYSSDVTLVNFLYNNIFINEPLVLLAQISVLSVVCLWVFSITKKFDSLKLMFYPKSLNSTILYFILYAFILLEFNLITIENELYKFIVLLALCSSRLGIAYTIYKNLVGVESSTQDAIMRIRLEENEKKTRRLVK